MTRPPSADAGDPGPDPAEVDGPAAADAPGAATDGLAERLRVAHDRRERARREPPGRLWRTVAQVGTLGWLLALPPVLGAVLGRALDRRLGTGLQCTLGLLALGVAGGGWLAWRAVERERLR